MNKKLTKQLLITVYSTHVKDILDLIKLDEMRTWIPKYFVGWVNVAVSNKKPYLRWNDTYSLNGVIQDEWMLTNDRYSNTLNGKVILRFWFEDYDVIDPYVSPFDDDDSDLHYLITVKQLERVRVSYEDICKYGKRRKLYLWHIKKLEIFETPKELSEFSIIKRTKTNLGDWYNQVTPLSKAPQRSAWVYVYE